MSTVSSKATDVRGKHARELRIIAGRWRGRRWRFPEAKTAGDALRPTPDRVRETLFNWLQPQIVGARCLDLFAGSGALGLEALSRGAAEVVFVESEAHCARSIREVANSWGASGYSVLNRTAATFLAGEPQALNVVFLDPPFAAGLLESTVEVLTRGWLAKDARVYVEHASLQPLPPLPATWSPLKSGKAGAVGYHLYAYIG
jgi:16S rRNA (guanine966-N2)-methyltransferase